MRPELVSKLNPMNERDKMCLCKRRFSSVEEATKSAQKRHSEKKCFVTLYVYECPYSEGEKHFHLTKHSRPVDPNLNDRVNVRVSP